MHSQILDYDFSQLPDWCLTLIGLLLTLIVASALFRLIRRGVSHALSADQKLATAICKRIAPATHYAVLLLAVACVLPALPLPAAAAAGMHRIMMAALTVLVGWGAILATNLSIERYVGRFRLDEADNLMARKTVTQMRVLRRTADVAIGIVTAAFALMQFETVREYGVSLFASAGIAGLAIGLAAKPLLSNLIAGIQLAVTQPIRIDDVVIVEGEWGWIEAFTATYVVIRIWDQRRLIVPLSYFLEKPFQNWTHTSADILGSVFLYTDYTVPVEEIRKKFAELVAASDKWDGRVASIQVTNATDRSMEVRALMSAANSSLLWDLRCDMREKLVAFLQTEYPSALPRLRAEMTQSQKI